jgi:hypothetical protein
MLKLGSRGVPSVCVLILLFAAGCGQGESVNHAVAPQAVRLGPVAPVAGDCLEAEISGGEESLEIHWERNGAILEGREDARLCGESLRKGDEVAVAVRRGGEELRSTVVFVNSPPRIIGHSVHPSRVFRGIDLTAHPEAVDADGDYVSIRFRWLINGEESLWDHDGTLPGERFGKGDRLEVEMTPHDGEAEGAPYLANLGTVPGAPPAFVSTPEVMTDTVFRYTARAVDPDGDRLTYALEEAPAGMTVSAAGVVTWAVSPEQAGEHQVGLSARDEEGLTCTQEFTLRVFSGVSSSQ